MTLRGTGGSSTLYRIGISLISLAGFCFVVGDVVFDLSTDILNDSWSYGGLTALLNVNAGVAPRAREHPYFYLVLVKHIKSIDSVQKIF